MTYDRNGTTASCIALIVAAGRGVRAGGGLPKQYRPLAGRPVLAHTLDAFCGHGGIKAVCVVIHPDDRALYDLAATGLPKLLAPAHGGAARQDSVRLGLEHLAAQAPDCVLIHDAARPFVDDGTITRVIAQLEHGNAAIPAVQVVDTLKRDDGARVTTVPRSGLWRAQTPQGFRFAAILDAHRRMAGKDLTDDAAVAEECALSVALVEGAESNMKLTTEADFQRAEQVLAARAETRTAAGFDVHGFGPGDHVWLCGVRVPHSHGLIGHSDADVALHALTDALLGTIAAGDIGQHFPPSDERWRGAASDRFLRHAAELVLARGGAIVHVDVTIICERPRIGPHRAAMCARLAEILGVASDRCSVKATTTEGLGFTGRREGIAAQAVATVRLPA
jgi:2-C-methyl-D-erythritol 4-phosphate cytidylyltransferase / 2-C-methyl-D-erythritol 2,4-cyclodiphosphate synthase